MKIVDDLTGMNLALAKVLVYEICLDLSSSNFKNDSSKTLGYAESQTFEDIHKLNQRLKSVCEQYGIPLPSAMIGIVERDPVTNDEYIINRLCWNDQEWVHHAIRTALECVRFR